MNRRALQLFALVALAACNTGDQTDSSPIADPPALAIQDGAHLPGNPDFFFLPPLVLPTSSYSNWTHNGFNRSLSPSVEICRLVATTVAQVNTPAGSQCRTTPAVVIISGTDVKKHFPPSADPSDVLTGLPGDWAHYHAKWPIPSSCNNTFFYRIRTKVGSVQLGFADVQCVTNLLQLLLVDYKKFGAAFKGTTLQIPFRVERYALCETPGVGPCGTASISLTTPSSTPLVDPTSGFVVGSVDVPAQDVPSTPGPVTINVAPCPDFRDRAVDPLDLPTFGPCLRVTTDPEVVLSNPAAVLVCTITQASGGQNVGLYGDAQQSHSQEHRITLHRRDETPTVTVHALPHVAGCPVLTASREGSLGGVLAALAKGRLKSAGGQFLGMFRPTTLYARRIDVGGGGLTSEFSDFQYAIPVFATITGGDGQAEQPGTTLPLPAEVTITDVGGLPVGGVRVRFLASGDGTPNPETVVSTTLTPGLEGKASTPWKLATAPGPNTLVARGFGIGGTDFNGPRSGVDPFQSIQHAFDPLVVDPSPLTMEELLKSGSVTFNATGGVDDPILVPFGSAGYDYLQFAHAGSPPPGWETIGFTPTGWSSGGSPFGSGDQSECGYDPTTNWDVNTRLVVRKSFNLFANQNIVIKIAIDNDVRGVFLNGVQLGGVFEHGGCAAPFGGSFAYYYGSATAGSNLIAVHTRDNGGSSYLDIQVEIDPGLGSGSLMQGASVRPSDLQVGPLRVKAKTKPKQ